MAFGEWPRTWASYVHGVAHLARAAAAEKLRMADAIAAHKQKPQDWKRWVSEHRTRAGG